MANWLHVYECYRAWIACPASGACYRRKPTLTQLARACGLKQWQCYAAIVAARWRVRRV